MVEEIPKGIRRSAKDKLLSRKMVIAEMEHEESASLAEKRIIFRKVLSGKGEKSKEADKITAFIVKAYETAILLQLGKVAGVLGEGIYEIEKEFQYSGTDIIWINKTEFQTRWGASDVYLSDSIKIGAFGSLIVKISDPKNFVLNVVAGKQVVERKAVDDFIFAQVVATYKDVLGGFTIDDVIRSRDTVKQKVTAKLFDILSHWGIELITLEVEGFKLPEGYEQIGEMSLEEKLEKARLAKTKTSMKGAVELDTLKTELEIEKEKAKIKSATELEREGRSVMKEQIETLRLKRELEASKRDITSDDRSFERQQELASSQTHYDKAKYDSGAKQIHGAVDVDLLEKKSSAEVAGKARITQIEADRDVNIAQAKAKGKDIDEKGKEKQKEVKKQINELKQKMSQFDDLLAQGKVSSDIYKMRMDRMEKDLKDLENKLDKDFEDE